VGSMIDRREFLGLVGAGVVIGRWPASGFGQEEQQGVRVDHRADKDIAWVHPQAAHGLFVELRKREAYA